MPRPPGFAAKYGTICSRCNSEIQPGDRVVPHAGSIIHVGCASGQDDE